MQPKSITPYGELEQKIPEALDFIIANLPMSPTVSQLNEVVLTAIFGAGPDTLMDDDIAPLFLQTILPLSYNGYVNGGGMTGDGRPGTGDRRWQTEDRGRTTGDNTSQPSSVIGDRSSASSNQLLLNTQYTDNQITIISQLLQGVKHNPPEALPDFFSDMQDKVAASGLVYSEQLPLYVAIETGKTVAAYWAAQLATPGGWALYMNADNAINYMHQNSWTSAAVLGALLSYNLYDPAESHVPRLYAGVVGAVALGAGKVVFGWNG